MRIALESGWYFPDSLGGTELYVAALARYLATHGHEVTVVAPDADHAAERHYAHEGIAVYRYPVPARLTRAQARGYEALPGGQRLHEWLRQFRPDVVHAHTLFTGFGLAELDAARQAGGRVFFTSHLASLGFVCERGTMMRDGRALCDGVAEPVKCAACALQQRGLPGILARVVAATPRRWSAAALAQPGRARTALGLRALVEGNREAQARLYAVVDRMVVLSDWAARALAANGAPAGKVVVNRLGVAPRPGGWPRKADAAMRPTTVPLTIGYVGRAEAIKGIADAVRAVSSLPASVPLRLRVVAVAGSPSDREELARCRALARGDARIVFEPAVAPRDVPALLASLDLLLCPSHVLEGGPTVALEAHAVGTPVVGADLPALNEVVRPGQTGALYPAGDWRALASLLASVAARPAVVDEWRDRLAPPRMMDDVCRDYEALYRA